MSKLKQSARGRGAAGKRQQRRQVKFKQQAPASQRTNILRDDDGENKPKKRKQPDGGGGGSNVFGLAGPKPKKYKQGPFARPQQSKPEPAAPDQPLGKKELKAQRDAQKVKRKPHFASVQARGAAVALPHPTSPPR